MQAFVTQQVKKLSDAKEAQDVQDAREALIEATQVANADALPTYLGPYANAVNDAIKPLKDHKDLRVRLNAAIVVARVAQAAKNTRLMECSQAFMQDGEEAVVLWGIKAAKYIIPQVLNNPMLAIGNGGKFVMVGAIVPAVKAHPDGPVVEEAYEALSVDPKDVPPTAIGQVVEQMFALFAWRNEQYLKGVPTEPLAERLPMNYLSTLFGTGAPKPLTPAQQLQVMQLGTDLMSLAAQRMSAGGVPEQLGPVIVMDAKAITAIGTRMSSNAVIAAVKNLKEMSNNPNPVTVQADVDAAIKAIAAVPEFKKLKPAPKIETAAGESATTQAEK
ncbi:MAG TPA: hypothetical protein VIL86_15115 [Tepidisphaeraceae bacterium]